MSKFLTWTRRQVSDRVIRLLITALVGLSLFLLSALLYQRFVIIEQEEAIEWLEMMVQGRRI